jgi:class 3 adenylate cyclase
MFVTLAEQSGAARAIRCAAAICQAVRILGLQIRVGLHAGQCKLVGDAFGITVHIGSRVRATASADEVLVSSTVKHLVVGSEITFDHIGFDKLKGLPQQWRLYRLL